MANLFKINLWEGGSCATSKAGEGFSKGLKGLAFGSTGLGGFGF